MEGMVSVAPVTVSVAAKLAAVAAPKQLALSDRSARSACVLG